MMELLREQYADYKAHQKILEAEIIRKYKLNEDCTEEVKNAAGLAMLMEGCFKLMSEYERNDQ